MITRVNPYFPAINKGVAHRGLVTPGFPNTTGAWLWFSDTQRVISADSEKEPEPIPVHDQLRRTPVY